MILDPAGVIPADSLCHPPPSPAPSDYEAMCRDYYTLQFMDTSVDTAPIAPALQVRFSVASACQLPTVRL